MPRPRARPRPAAPGSATTAAAGDGRRGSVRHGRGPARSSRSTTQPESSLGPTSTTAAAATRTCRPRPARAPPSGCPSTVEPPPRRRARRRSGGRRRPRSPAGRPGRPDLQRDRRRASTCCRRPPRRTARVAHRDGRRIGGRDVLPVISGARATAPLTTMPSGLAGDAVAHDHQLGGGVGDDAGLAVAAQHAVLQRKARPGSGTVAGRRPPASMRGAPSKRMPSPALPCAVTCRRASPGRPPAATVTPLRPLSDASVRRTMTRGRAVQQQPVELVAPDRAAVDHQSGDPGGEHAVVAALDAVRSAVPVPGSVSAAGPGDATGAAAPEAQVGDRHVGEIEAPARRARGRTRPSVTSSSARPVTGSQLATVSGAALLAGQLDGALPRRRSR